MEKPKFFKSKTAGKIPLPVFFPDATKAVIRTLDSKDIENTKTLGVLVNTYHLFKNPGKKMIEMAGGVRNFMNYHGAVISDSGGFQVGSLIKKNPQLGTVTDKGVIFKFPGQKPSLLTPESSIDFQMTLNVDMVVALDDFDAPNASEEIATDSVRRTILWAERSKKEFERICDYKQLTKNQRPYLLGVVQGGRNLKLRKHCIDELVKIGFDGLGYGGEDKISGKANHDLAQFIADNTPKNYMLYALGVGKPEDIVDAAKMGYQIFDCVLPTRDARHGRLYVYKAESISKIDLTKGDFYHYYNPKKIANSTGTEPVSKACDCLTCTNYTKAYLYHLFKIGDSSAMRLATIHNLRFYSILIEKIRKINFSDKITL